MFSSRLPPKLARNTLSRSLAEFGRSGTTVIDLTETNPTVVGLACSTDALARLADPRAITYRPDPIGLDGARRAVADACRDGGARIDPDRIVLTASTSEAYAFLFKLLCDPGDQVLVPRPGYPLFDLLTGLEGVAAISYRLLASDAWAVDRVGVNRALSPASRAILVVSPNNPTGSMLRSADRDWIVSVAAERGMAVIADEVFGDYPLSPPRDACSLLGEDRALTFTLGGLSKSAGMPQMKLAWIAASGPEVLVDQALGRLEMIADTYLSVSTPVQMAAGDLLEEGREVRRAIADRLSRNLAHLRSVVRSHPSLSLLEPEGGWSAVLRIPALVPEEQVVLRLLHDVHVLAHPGYFFDFEEEAFLVLSLLPEPALFEEGLSRLAGMVTGEPA